MQGIIGAICGDIIGSTREFNPIKTKNFQLLEINSTFTDDTILTLAIAKWLTDDKNYSQKTLIKNMQELTRLYPNAGYGGSFSKWIISDNPQPYNSWGNGSAMRVSPVAWITSSLDKTEELAKISAIVTHNAPEGVVGAQATASAIYLARTGESKREIKTYIEDKYHYNLSRKIDDIRPTYTFEVSCQKSVPEAIISFLESDSYIDSIRNAISLGGDADTQSAIAGSIAAAYYKDGVPEKIANKCINILSDDLQEILNNFNDTYNM